jgi:hypothetical protein
VAWRWWVGTVVGAVAFGFAASAVVQWASGRSPFFSMGLAVVIALVLAGVGLLLLRLAIASI